jgi:pSer/pThr/pTyr-binding forkhead associated (FHA) protein
MRFREPPRPWLVLLLPKTGFVPMAAKPGSDELSLNIPALVPSGSYAKNPPLRLAKPVVLIGSEKACHLRLVSSTVSRYHALLITSPEGCYIRDLISRSRVTVDGQPVVETDLQDGNAVAIGRFTFQFKAPSQGFISPTPIAPAAIAIKDVAQPTVLHGKVTLIGRQNGCDIQIAEEAVSSRHAVIFAVNGKRYLRDLNSRTGTFLNGSPIHQKEISLGDEIRIGETVLELIAAPEGAEELTQPAVDEPFELPRPAEPAAVAAKAAPTPPPQDQIDLNTDPDVADVASATAMMEPISEPVARGPIDPSVAKPAPPAPAEEPAVGPEPVPVAEEIASPRGWRRTNWQDQPPAAPMPPVPVVQEQELPPLELPPLEPVALEEPVPVEAEPVAEQIEPARAPAFEEYTSPPLELLPPLEEVPLEEPAPAAEEPLPIAEPEPVAEEVTPAAVPVVEEHELPSLEPALLEEPAPAAEEPLPIAEPEPVAEEVAPAAVAIVEEHELLPLEPVALEEPVPVAAEHELQPIEPVAVEEPAPVAEAPIPVENVIPLEVPAPEPVAAIEAPEPTAEIPTPPIVEQPVAEVPVDVTAAPRKRGRPKKIPAVSSEPAPPKPRGRRKSAPDAPLVDIPVGVVPETPAVPESPEFANLQLNLQPESESAPIEEPAPPLDLLAPAYETTHQPLIAADLHIGGAEPLETPDQNIEQRIEGLQIREADFMQMIPSAAPVPLPEPVMEVDYPEAAPASPPSTDPDDLALTALSEPTSEPLPPEVFAPEEPEQSDEFEDAAVAALESPAEPPPAEPVEEVAVPLSAAEPTVEDLETWLLEPATEPAEVSLEESGSVGYETRTEESVPAEIAAAPLNESPPLEPAEISIDLTPEEISPALVEIDSIAEPLASHPPENTPVAAAPAIPTAIAPSPPPARPAVTDWTKFDLNDGFFNEDLSTSGVTFSGSFKSRGKPTLPKPASATSQTDSVLPPPLQGTAGAVPPPQYVPTSAPVVEPMEMLFSPPLFQGSPIGVDHHLGGMPISLPELPAPHSQFGRVAVTFPREAPPPPVAEQPTLAPAVEESPEEPPELVEPLELGGDLEPEVLSEPSENLGGENVEVIEPPPEQPAMPEQVEMRDHIEEPDAPPPQPRPKTTIPRPPPKARAVRPTTFASDPFFEVVADDFTGAPTKTRQSTSFASAFEGLAMPAVQERDVFSNFAGSPLSGGAEPAVDPDLAPSLDRDFADDDFWNRTDDEETEVSAGAPPAAGPPTTPSPPANEPVPEPEIPDDISGETHSGDAEGTPPPAVPPAPVSPPAKRSVARTVVARKPAPLMSVGEKLAPRLQESASRRPPAVGPAAPMSPKKKKWRFFSLFLFLMLLCIGGALVAIQFVWPAKAHVVGTLTYLNFNWVDGTDDGNAFAAQQRRLLEDPATASHARDVLAQNHAQLAGGFLADPVAYLRVADGFTLNTIRPNDAPRTILTLDYSGKDQTNDGLRVAAMLQALFDANGPILAENRRVHQVADQARQVMEDAQKKVQEIQDQIDAQQRIIDQAPSTDELAVMNDKTQGLHKARIDAEDVVENDRATLARLQASTPVNAPGSADDGSPATQPSVDPQLQQMQQEMDDLSSRLAAAKNQQTAGAVEASSQLQQAVKDFNDQLTSAQSKLDDASQLKQFLVSVGESQSKAHDLIQTMLVDGQDLQQQTEEARRDVEELIQTLQQAKWDADVQLQNLNEGLDSAQHRYNAAVGQGVKDASVLQPLQAEIDDWTTKVKKRQAELGVDPSEIRAQDNMNKLLDTMRRKLGDEKKQIADVLEPVDRQLSDMNPTITAMPANQQDIAKAIRQSLETLNKANQQYAEVIGQGETSPSTSVMELQKNIDELKSRFDRRQADLTMQMQQSLGFQRGRALADAQQTLDKDKQIMEEAKNSYDAARLDYDQAAGRVDDAQAATVRLSELKQELKSRSDERDAAVTDADRKQAAADRTFDIQPLDPTAVVVVPETDPRREYSLMSVAVLAVLFAAVAILIPRGERYVPGSPLPLPGRVFIAETGRQAEHENHYSLEAMPISDHGHEEDGHEALIA